MSTDFKINELAGEIRDQDHAITRAKREAYISSRGQEENFYDRLRAISRRSKRMQRRLERAHDRSTDQEMDWD